MATDNVVNELIVNKLTQAQFDAIPEAERSDTELYFITDSEGDGDYLPLSGGTLDGDLAFAKSKKIILDNPTGDSYGDSYIMHRGSAKGVAIGYIYNDEFVDNFYFKTSRAVGIGLMPASAAGATLGNDSAKWTAAYVKKLNNGADIAVPTTGGTLARLEDIPEDTQLETLPAASADNLNKIYQYVGETTSDYINGHFYKCVEASVTNLTMMNSFMNGASATLDQEKFLAQNPVFADPSMSNTPFPAWRADYQGDGTWNVWTQTPNLTIDPTELADVWGITISGELQEYDMIAVMKQEEMEYAWKEVALGNSTADIPAHPTTPGAYTLMCYVDENGSASYAWENVA